MLRILLAGVLALALVPVARAAKPAPAMVVKEASATVPLDQLVGPAEPALPAPDMVFCDASCGGGGSPKTGCWETSAEKSGFVEDVLWWDHKVWFDYCVDWWGNLYWWGNLDGFCHTSGVASCDNEGHYWTGSGPGWVSAQGYAELSATIIKWGWHASDYLDITGTAW